MYVFGFNEPYSHLRILASLSGTVSMRFLGAPPRARLGRCIGTEVPMPPAILDKLRAEALTQSDSERAALQICPGKQVK
jgi:hypothetical protein